MRNCIHRWPRSGYFFLQIRVLFSNFRKRAGETSLPPPSSYALGKRLHYYCEVFQNTYFERHLWAAACENQHLSGKFRSSRPEVFCKKGVFAKFTEKHLCQSLLCNKVVGLRLWHRCFSVNFVKFLRRSFFIEHLLWLPLQIYRSEVIPEFY